MLLPTRDLLSDCHKGGYAVGAFNIYNLEGATAVVQAAEQLRSPVMIQLLPKALSLGGKPLVALCLKLAEDASVPVALHLDHCSSKQMISNALECGISSIMADGSEYDFEENIRFTREIVREASSYYTTWAVEAELGKLSGEEDGVHVAGKDARMTDPEEAQQFVEETGVTALAVCIGNIHGKYSRPPELDFGLLGRLKNVVSVPLVLHGTSGLPDEMITAAIQSGVCKFNVNTELRMAYLGTMKKMFDDDKKVELVEIMEESMNAMMIPIQEKMKLFCSDGRA